MSEKPKGIVNPWLKVEPIRPVPRKPDTDRIDLDDIDRDADLAEPGQYVIRSKHAAFRIVHVRIETPKDALAVLAECVAEAWRVKGLSAQFHTAGIGVRCRTGAWNVPDDVTPASKLEGERTIIWFVNKTIDQGMLDLARILRAAGAASATTKWGVTPMLSG